MKTKKTLKFASISLLAILVLTIFLSSYVYADEAEDTRAAFAASVAFGKLKSDRAILPLKSGPIDLFIIRNRVDFEKAVDKVKTRLLANPQFYSQTLFGNPWTHRDEKVGDIHALMQKKAKELDVAEPGTVDYYYSQFGEQKGKITLDIKLKKDNIDMTKGEPNTPLVKVIRKRDNFVIHSATTVSTKYSLDRENYDVEFGILPGYGKPKKCEIDITTETDYKTTKTYFECIGNYDSKKTAGKQITAKAISTNRVEIKFPTEMESSASNLQQVTTYEIKDNVATSTALGISTPNKGADPDDADYLKITLDLASSSTFAEDKTYTLTIKDSGGSNTLATAPIVTGNLADSRNENPATTLPDTPENIGQIKDVSLEAQPSQNNVVVEQGQNIDLKGNIKKIILKGGTRTVGATPTVVSVSDEDLTDPKEMAKWSKYFKWKWNILKWDTATSAFVLGGTRTDANAISFSQGEAGTYKVELSLTYLYPGPRGMGWIIQDETYPLTQTPISWTINVVGNTKQLAEKEQEIINKIGEIERTYELAADLYLRKDKTNAEIKIAEGKSQATAATTAVDNDLPGHVRNAKYKKEVMDLTNKFDVLKTKVDVLTSAKTMAAINELVQKIIFDPLKGDVSGGVSEIKITPFDATSKPAAYANDADANTEVTKLIKKITKYESTQFEPIVSVDKAATFPYTITPQTKIIKLELFYTDPITNEEILVTTLPITWKLGEIERPVINRDYKINAPGQIIKGQLAEFVVIKEDNSEETGAANFLWIYSMGSGIFARESSTTNKFSKNFDVPGEYVIEASFELGGKRITGVKQRFIVSDLTTFTDAQLIAEYNKANVVLIDAKDYVAKVEKNPTTADIAIIDEHLRKLGEAGEVYKQVDAKKGTIFSVIGLSDSRFSDVNTEITTTLPAKLNAIKNKKNELDGNKLPTLIVKFGPEIIKGKINKGIPIELKVVVEGTGEEIAADKIKSYTWTILKGSTPQGSPEPTTANKITRTFSDAGADYKVSVKFKSDKEHTDITDQMFEVINLGATDNVGVINQAVAEADAKLAKAKTDFESTTVTPNLEEDLRLASEAKTTYDDVKKAIDAMLTKPTIDIDTKIGAAKELADKITEKIKQRDITAGKILPALEIKFEPEIAEKTLIADKEIKFSVVETGSKVASEKVTSKITKYTWVIKQGTTDVLTKETVINELTHTLSKGDYKIYVAFESSISVPKIENVEFKVRDPSAKTSTDEELNAILEKEGQRLEEIKRHLAEVNIGLEQLEQDKRIVEEIIRNYKKIIANLAKRSITKESVQDKINAADRILQQIQEKIDGKLANVASKVLKIEVLARNSLETLSKTANQFRPGANVYITAVSKDNTDTDVQYNNIKWKITDGTTDLTLPVATSTNLENIAIDGNKISARIRDTAAQGIKITFVASVGTISSEPFKVIVISDVSSKVILADGKDEVATIAGNKATKVGDDSIKYIKFDYPKDVWFKYTKLTDEYVTSLHELTLRQRKISPEQFQAMLDKNK